MLNEPTITIRERYVRSDVAPTIILWTEEKGCVPMRLVSREIVSGTSRIVDNYLVQTNAE